MKIKLNGDDMWKLYIADETNLFSFGFDVEVPDELIERFKVASKAFRTVEDELYEFYLAAKKVEDQKWLAARGRTK